LIEVVLAIAFGSCNFKEKYDAAAVLEWAIAFIFTFYVLSFFIDLIPAVHTRNNRFPHAETEMQQEANDEMSNSRTHHGNRDTLDSQRTLTNVQVDGTAADRTKPAVGRNF
jgi:hypothetical protein